MARKKTSKVKKATTKFIKVGVLGQTARDVILDSDTTAQQIADQIGVGSFRAVKATKKKDFVGGYSEIQATDIVNGYTALLFMPKVDGGK